MLLTRCAIEDSILGEFAQGRKDILLKYSFDKDCYMVETIPGESFGIWRFTHFDTSVYGFVYRKSIWGRMLRICFGKYGLAIGSRTAF